jgi:two-component system OmpR family sensor kinase
MHEQLTRWWNGVSLRTKITGVTVLLLTLGLVVAGLGTMSVLRSYLLDQVDDKILSNAQTLTGTIEYKNTASGVGCTITFLHMASTDSYYVGVIDSDGRLMCDNRAQNQSRPVLQGLSLSVLQNHDTKFTVPDTRHVTQWRMLASLPDSVDQVTVLVGISLDDTNGLIARYAAAFLFFALTVVLLGGALTRLLVTSTFTPLLEVEQTAARFAAGDFSQRLGGNAPNTEVGRLSTSLNTMLSRIDSAFSDRARTIDQMRRFVGDASHELRTPLVSVRGYAELYRMGAISTPDEVAQAMERIEKEAIRMGELVEDLLELARIDEAKPLKLAPVDLLPLAHDAALDAMAYAPDRRVTVVLTDPIREERAPVVTVASGPTARSATLATGPIKFAGATLAWLRRRPRPTRELSVETLVETEAAPMGATVLAEENKIRQVITNLMGNALRFTPAGSPIEIAITVDEPGDSAILSVIDHGDGIPEQIRDKIFQRFWRADNSRNRDTGGTGLGLAIVASLVASHRGSVDVVETPGGGSTFRVRLPLLHEAPTANAAPAPA